MARESTLEYYWGDGTGVIMSDSMWDYHAQYYVENLEDYPFLEKFGYKKGVRSYSLYNVKKQELLDEINKWSTDSN